MRRHSGRPIRPASQRRKLVWADSQGQVNPLNVAGSGVNFDLLASYRTAGGSTQGITIIRTHMNFSVSVASPTGASGVDVGLIVGTTTDTAAELNPSHSYDDWMFLKTFYIVGNAANIVSGTWYNAYEIDVRSKRKCQEVQQTYYASLAARDSATTSLIYHARTLLALP